MIYCFDSIRWNGASCAPPKIAVWIMWTKTRLLLTRWGDHLACKWISDNLGYCPLYSNLGCTANYFSVKATFFSEKSFQKSEYGLFCQTPCFLKHFYATRYTFGSKLRKIKSIHSLPYLKKSKKFAKKIFLFWVIIIYYKNVKNK